MQILESLHNPVISMALIHNLSSPLPLTFPTCFLSSLLLFLSFLFGGDTQGGLEILGSSDVLPQPLEWRGQQTVMTIAHFQDLTLRSYLVTGIHRYSSLPKQEAAWPRPRPLLERLSLLRLLFLPSTCPISTEHQRLD